MTDSEKRYLWAEPAVAWGAFFVLLATYWLTVAPTVSFWDCPEYVSAAALLEVGHPPGNPTWMLVERIVTMLAPSPQYAALAVNMSSGLFTAFAAFFLAKTIFRVALWVLLKLPRRHIPAPVAAAGGALTGALAFGWCDSIWYSAVEAEVYAMSIFMTSLCVWLMAKWAGTRNRGDSWRLLVLIAYLFGLSIGVHQLNLLCIPALAMVWAVRRGIYSTGRLALIFLLSLAVVACVLMGMMPSTIALAAEFEVLAVNSLGLPALSGVAIYVALLGVSLLGAIVATSRARSRAVMAAACFPAVFLSGIFILSEHFLAGAVVSAAVSALLVCGSNFKARRLYLSIWMLAMLLTGYSSYALIPVRGSVPSPANAAMPGEPFAFASYLSREQYGSKPLLYGPTPYSRTMLREKTGPDGRPTYRFFALDYTRPIHVPKEEGGRLRHSVPGLSHEDSLRNAALMDRDGDAYIVRGMKSQPVKTPELNMWFPRITSSNPADIASYADWIGMDSASMVEVEISEAVDSAGNYVAKMDAAGRRGHPTGLRPTYMQNLEWFAMYQTSYMYWRYLLWNFAGRQNDRPAQGEVQHGNFITGFPAIDNAMLGAEDSLPPVAGSENKGRNRYWLVPLALGILGMAWLLKSRRRGMQTCAVTAVLFVMTGLAITVYLNQDPGEPRERDYSFLGSFLAYSVWIGFGAIMIARRFRSPWAFLIPLVVPVWMCAENYDDHDRSGRYAARNFAFNMLNSLERDAVVFVNGDNYTFPLWYAQEVEGVRRDVRVVNLAYLATPRYSANLMADWRESRALETTFGRGDLIWEAFRMARLESGNTDTLPAVEALRRLRDSADETMPARYATLRVSADSTAVFDLRRLVSGGGNTIDFGRLMMFDIVATNAASDRPRPIYWLGALTPDKRLGMTDMTSPWIFGRRFGLADARETDSLLVAAASRFVAPNPLGREVYMDHAPSMQVAAMRGALTNAGATLLDHGRLADAVDLARKADIMMGDAPDSYGGILVNDSAYSVRRELATLLTRCGESLRRVAARTDLPETARKKLDAEGIELMARGRYHMNRYLTLRRQWSDYRRALPPRLRGKMSPTY